MLSTGIASDAYKKVKVIGPVGQCWRCTNRSKMIESGSLIANGTYGRKFAGRYFSMICLTSFRTFPERNTHYSPYSLWHRLGSDTGASSWELACSIPLQSRALPVLQRSGENAVIMRWGI